MCMQPTIIVMHDTSQFHVSRSEGKIVTSKSMCDFRKKISEDEQKSWMRHGQWDATVLAHGYACSVCVRACMSLCVYV